MLIPNTLLNISGITEAIVETITEMATIVYSANSDEAVYETTTQATLKTDSEIMRIINDIRQENNLKPLAMNIDLCLVAEIRAEEASEKWSHIRSDGTKVDAVASEMDISWKFLGENLANHKNASGISVVDTWMNSELHRKNILNPKFKQCGIGEFIAGDTTYVALIFSD